MNSTTLSRGRIFLLTLTDDEGNIHDLGSLAFGLISPLSQEEVKALASSLVESVTDKATEIDVDSWENWHKKNNKCPVQN